MRDRTGRPVARGGDEREGRGRSVYCLGFQRIRPLTGSAVERNPRPRPRLTEAPLPGRDERMGYGQTDRKSALMSYPLRSGRATR
jgi:hypothetical protein